MRQYTLFAVFVQVIGLVADAGAQQTTATLRITVEKRVYGENVSRPFQGVGTFDLVRGASKLDGAKCPDKSGPTGQLTCTIPCKHNDAIPMLVRVKPPSNQDSLAGWVTPSALDIEVNKCAVKPTTVTMLYEDARFALNQFLGKQYFAASGTGGPGKGPSGSTPIGKSWIAKINEDPTVAAKLTATSDTAVGRAELIELHKIATEAASAPSLQSSDLSPEEKELASALARWQVLSKSALLKAQISKAVPQREWSLVLLTPTTDLAKYQANLTHADDILSRVTKSSAQLRLADDVKTLKATPSIGKEAVAAERIISGWK